MFITTTRKKLRKCVPWKFVLLLFVGKLANNWVLYLQYLREKSI